MKVLLLENIKNLGEKGSVVNVTSGYARNYLMPLLKAVSFNSKSINDFNKKVKDLNKTFINVYKELDNTTIIVPVKIKKGNEIYGSFNSIKLSQIIKKLKLNLSIKNLINNVFFKNIGNYKVEFKTKEKNKNINIFIILVNVNNEYK